MSQKKRQRDRDTNFLETLSLIRLQRCVDSRRCAMFVIFDRYQRYCFGFSLENEVTSSIKSWKLLKSLLFLARFEAGDNERVSSLESGNLCQHKL